MEAIFERIMEAVKRRHFSDEQADMPREELEKLRADIDAFDRLQQTSSVRRRTARSADQGATVIGGPGRG